MKASEARILSDSNKSNLTKTVLEKIYCEIKKCASHGNSVYHYNLESNRDGIPVDTIIKNLRNDGYSVNHVYGSDCRGGESWNYLVISW